MVFLLNTLVPNTAVKLPELITTPQLKAALDALEEIKSLLPPPTVAPLADALNMCHDAQQTWKVRPVLDKCITAYRSELYKGGTDPYQRLQLHQAIMAAGFYDRSAHVHVNPGENSRFLINHYNFDVRRDTVITKAVHTSILESRVTTEESDRILTDVLLMERRLFGENRFIPVGGKQWLCAGMPLTDIHSDEELKRVLALTPIKTNGNFDIKEETDDGSVDKKKTADRWKKTVLVCLPEKTEVVATKEMFANSPAQDKIFTITTLLPAPPLSWGERLRERMLYIFVCVFATWLSFWFVDEEIITVITMVILKWWQMRNLEIEREATGERKLYIAQMDNGVRYTKTKQY